MRVEYIDHMGNDLRVVNAARVSFGKWTDKFRMKDARLIRWLAKKKHWTPFAHPQITIRVTAPIFVARQLGKHQIGLVWNEVSRRYVDDEPTFWSPEGFRLRAEDVKQGSSDEVLEGFEHRNSKRLWHDATITCLEVYNALLSRKVAPEIARAILPQSMYTQWIWTGSLMAFARVCQQRLDPHAQREVQEIARQIEAVIRPQFPVSWDALMGRVPDEESTDG